MNKFFRILSFMHKKIVYYLIGLIAIALLNMLFQLTISDMFRKMFDYIAAFNFEEMLDVVVKYMIGLVIIFTIIPFFLYLTGSIAVSTTGNIRQAVFTKLTKLPIPFFKAHHSGDTTSRMTNDINEMEKAYKEHFINFITSVLTGIGTTIFMFFIEWRLALIAMSGGLITVFINFYFSKRLRVISDEVQERLAKLNERLSNIISGLKVIRVFNISEVILKKFYHSSDDVYHSSNKRVNTQAVVDSLNSLVSIISFVGITTIGAYLVIIDEITIGDVVAIDQLQNGVVMLFNSLGKFISQMQGSLAASNRVFEVLDEPLENEKIEIGDLTGQGIVEFRNVSFSYNDLDLIKNLNFSVPEHKVYALVGASGSGKSTVFKLLLQFYQLKSGSISVLGQNDIHDIRDLIAYVPQDAFLFSGSIRDNIKYGKKDATDEEIIEAAKLANCHDFIMSFEKGYDTEVLENGAKLSGGERQRIAIARAFLKDAPILLLDEATASLDNESEALIQNALSKLMKNRTTLIIAHRLSTIKNVDQILVLDKGSIVETGTHDELLKIGGQYANLYQKQFN